MRSRLRRGWMTSKPSITRRRLLVNSLMLSTSVVTFLSGDNVVKANQQRTDNRKRGVLGAETITDVGSGRVLVFSHGFMMDRSMFEPQLRAFRDKYRVITFDSRARFLESGESYDLDDLVEDCKALLDQLDVQRCVLVGMSMGGWMALRFALKYPDRLDGLVLIDSSADADSKEKKRVFQEKFQPLLECETLPADYVAWVMPLMFGKWTIANNPQLVASWREKFLNYRCDAVYREAGSWREREDISAAITDIHVPTLILHGQQDMAEPVADAAPMVDLIPNAELVTIPRAGHTSNLEQPALVNRAISTFLRDKIYD